MTLLVCWSYTVYAQVVEQPPLPGGGLETLIRNLGHERFTERERAANQLVRSGMDARSALVAGLKNADAEIRLRCRRILATVLENDFRRRLDAFAVGRDLTDDHGLAGWKRFGEIVGTGASQRSLFVEMHQTEGLLLQAAADDPRTANEAFLMRCQQLQQAMAGKHLVREPIQIGSVASLLFVASDEHVSLTAQMASHLNGFCYQKSVNSAMGGGSLRQPLRKLMGLWIGRSGNWTSYQTLRLAMRYQLTEGLEPARKVLNGDVPRPRHVLQYAILAVAKLGSQEEMPLLESMLQDQTLCASRTVNAVAYRTEIRDIALVGLFHLAGLDPKVNGFPQLQEHPEMLFAPNSLGFAKQEGRDAAQLKWKEYRGKTDGQQ